MMAVIVSLILMFLAGSVTAVDLTVTSKATGTDVVEAVVDLIQQTCIFADDRLLLRRIAAVETDDGRDNRTFYRNGVDFYGGIWQMDERSFEATKTSANSTVYNQIKIRFGIDWPVSVAFKDLLKPLYSGLAARLKIDAHFIRKSIPQDVNSQALYWAINYTSNAWGSLNDAIEQYKDASNRTATRCSSPTADVIFVLDGSGSVGSNVFQDVLQFVIDVVRLFVIGTDNVRVSVIQFSDSARIEFNLTAYNTSMQLIDAISRIRYMGGGTDTVSGLRAMESVVLSEGRQDQGIPVVAILMTDGQSNNPAATTAEAKRIHQALGDKMVVYSIGVGSGIQMSELEAIASSPSCQYVFLLTSFDDITAFSYQLMKAACKAPAQLPEGVSITGLVQKGESYYFKASGKQDKRGIEINIKTPVGSFVKLYVSWTIQNPSPALYDYTADVDSSAINGGVTVMVPWPQTNALRLGDVNGDVHFRHELVTYEDELPMMTLYGTVEGAGDNNNSFELRYVISDLSSSATSTAASHIILLPILLALLCLRGH